EVVFTAPLDDVYKNELRKQFPDITYQFTSPETIEHHLQSATVLATYGNDLTKEMIERAEHVKWIMVLSAGVDELPIEAIKKRNIVVTNAQGIHKVPMSEYVISMLLQVSREEKRLIENERKHQWERSLKFQTKEISGKTMLVFGTGAIGQEVARIAKAFRMTTYGISRSGKQVEHIDTVYSIEQKGKVLSEADFVISVLPSTEETRQLFTYDVFCQMKREAIFLNMGRGDAVVEEDLLQAMKEERICHAILDVFRTEPLHSESPFWQEENITITPHTSGVSEHYITRALDIFTENLAHWIEHEDVIVNQVDLTKGY